MKSSSEIRAEAWRILRKTPWGWRLLGIGVFVGIISALVMNALTSGFEEAGIQTWTDFYNAAIKAKRNALDLAVPSLRVAAYMTVATAFTFFISWIFSGIQSFATSFVALESVIKEDSKNWFVPALAGFKRPFEMFSLMFFWSLRMGWWMILGAFILGVGAGLLKGFRLLASPVVIVAAVAIVCASISLTIVAAYRYRFVWFVKVQHPDWGANRCLNEIGRLMEGKKWKSFLLDCSYWKAITVLLGGFLIIFVLAIGAEFFESSFVVMGVLFFFFLLFFVVFGIYLSLYFSFGYAVFYRELLTEGGICSDEPIIAAPAEPEQEAV